jgi:hypothetical protein
MERTLMLNNMENNRDLYTCAVTFNDEPSVIHVAKFMMDARGVPLKLLLQHPRSEQGVWVYYRGTSTRGKKLYRYSEGTRAGEALGG